MKTRLLYIVLSMFFVLSTAFINKKGKAKDSLDGKSFTLSVTESKKGKPGKPTEDALDFGKGEMKFKTVTTDMEVKLKYEITKDSTFTEADEEMVYAEFQASEKKKDESEVKVNGKVNGEKIEGSIEWLDKKGKVKKHFDFTGDLKTKKKKKK